MELENVTLRTKRMIDDLKTICANNGLGGSPGEYKIITQVFLYKYISDKFLYEARKAEPSLADAENIEAALTAMPDDQYEMMTMMLGGDTARLKKTHYISYLFNHQNDDTMKKADGSPYPFHELFDDTLVDIANHNLDIFSVQTGGEEKIRLFDPISQYVIETEKKSKFCRAIINKLVEFNFSEVFEQEYDFFSQIFEYLIKDYNKDFGKYAEYYTPHAIASIIARIMVQGDVRNVTVYDPAAGSGTLVLALAHQIGEQNCTIFTQDISAKSNEFLRLNLILNNLVHSLGNVVHDDTLISPRHLNARKNGLAKFDYIVSNPPFNVDFSDNRDELASQKHSDRFFVGVPNIPNQEKDGMAIYLVFLQHIIFSLAPRGKAAIVVPSGFLTVNKNTNRIAATLREFLIQQKMIRGVITMPSNIFANTPTSVSVLFIENDAPLTDEIVLIDASHLGKKTKDGNNQRTVLSNADITKILSSYHGKKTADGFCVCVSFEIISQKKYSFKAGEYFKVPIHENQYSYEEYYGILTSYHGNLRTLFNFDYICANAVNTVFDYWFNQYEFPDMRNGNKPYKSSGGKMCFSPEIGTDIPKGWEVKRLVDICDILLGGTPDTAVPEYWNGNIPWLNSGEIANFPIRQSEKSITELGMRNSATSFATKGSVLISITRYIRASILEIDACFNQSVVAVVPNKKYQTVFLYPFIVSKIPLYMSLRTGAQQPHINKGTVENTYLAIPPKDVMEEYVNYIETVYEDILRATKKAANEICVGDFSMPKLMNGQATAE